MSMTTSDVTYLESFIDGLSTLPQEIRRNLELMKDLDRQCRHGSDRLKKLYREYIHHAEAKMMELQMVVDEEEVQRRQQQLVQQQQQQQQRDGTDQDGDDGTAEDGDDGDEEEVEEVVGQSYQRIGHSSSSSSSWKPDVGIRILRNQEEDDEDERQRRRPSDPPPSTNAGTAPRKRKSSIGSIGSSTTASHKKKKQRKQRENNQADEEEKERDDEHDKDSSNNNKNDRDSVQEEADHPTDKKKNGTDTAAGRDDDDDGGDDDREDTASKNAPSPPKKDAKEEEEEGTLPLVVPTTDELLMYTFHHPDATPAAGTTTTSAGNVTGTAEASAFASVSATSTTAPPPSSCSPFVNTYRIIQTVQRECLQKVDEKVAIAKQAYDMVDAVVKRLDHDIRALEHFLQSTGELSYGPGGAGAAGMSATVAAAAAAGINPKASGSGAAAAAAAAAAASLQPKIPKPGDLAACQVTADSEWILGKVLHHDTATGLYQVADEDVESNKVFTLPESQVIVSGVEKLSRGDTIFAVYPDTTSFYQATVVTAPRKNVSGGAAGAFVMVNFVDDSDEYGITHDKAIPMRHVIFPPHNAPIIT